MVNKLNLGSGGDYREGFVNLDINKNERAEVYADMNKKLPFPDSHFDFIYIDNALEHVDDVIFTINEMHRICKPHGIIVVYVPHFSSINNLKILTHKFSFGIDSFGIFTKNAVSKSFPCLFEVTREKLIYSHRNSRFGFPPFINWFFNFNKYWQVFCERYFLFGFDEIYYRLKVIK